MGKTVTIRFPDDQNEQSTLIHRLRNFGEDVLRKLRDENGWGSIDIAEVDGATTHFLIVNVKASKVLRLLSWLQAEAETHHLQIVPSVSSQAASASEHQA